MMTLGGNRRLPGLGRAGLAPGLGIPLNGIPSLPGINPIGGRGFVSGGFRGLGGGLAGGRLNGNVLGGGVPGLGIGGFGTLNGLGTLGGMGPLNPLGTLNTVNPLVNPLTGALFGNQLNPSLPLNGLQKQLIAPNNLLALQTLAATGSVAYNDLLGLHRHEKDEINSCCNSDSQARRTFDCKTKDITVRGKAYGVRAVYLTDVPKFESDLIKFMDKKKEDDVPDRVVNMLVQFINHECYHTSSVLDEVTLCILASNVGSKSAVEYTVKSLKSRNGTDSISDADELVKIVYTIMASSRVDEGLVEWLKKLLMKDNFHALFVLIDRSNEYLKMWEQLPEIHDRVLKLVGWKPQENGDFGRTV